MISCYKIIQEMQAAVSQWRAEGLRTALVPTMGGLHEGHLALVKAAMKTHDKIVVSLYVNPTQFAAHEDLDNYPRQQETDLALLAQLGDKVCAFAPDSLYQEDHATFITPQGCALPLEGVHRPHFFQGVATVVMRLFQAVPAHSAYFGEKDFQQLAVIRQMVRDFNWPITIHAVPTMRASDGLALSSRNAYLSAADRAIAPRLYQLMQSCAQDVASGIAPDAACTQAITTLHAEGFGNVDYFAFHDAVSLQPTDKVTASTRLMAALWLGQTRLIDNDSFENLCNAQ